MRSCSLFVVALALVVAAESAAAYAAEPIRVLLMTGQNNHNWKATTPVYEKLINEAGRFALTVDHKPWEFGGDAFDNCDVVLSNWSVWPKVELDPWGGETKQAFLRFIEGGGGLVVVHAGSSVHYQWQEFQTLVGKTWINGSTWHGKKHEFLVTPNDGHPITAGMEPFRIYDELWRDMVPTGKFETWATADTSGDERNAGPEEPMLMTTRRGEGRGVNLVLGHDTRSMSNAGFQQLLLRSLEWAATGRVAEAAPAVSAADE